MKTIYTIAIVVVVIGSLLVSGYAVTTLNLAKTNTSSSTGTTSSTSSSTTSSLTSISSSFSSSTTSGSSSSLGTTTTSCCSTNVLNIGYFANINHAPGLIGITNGTFAAALDGKVTINTFLFTSGTTEITSLLAGQLDMAYIGPGPAVTGFQQSNGQVKIVAGVADAGAEFVVSDSSGITNATTPGGIASLAGKTFAAPGLGTLRTLLSEHILKTTV